MDKFNVLDIMHITTIDSLDQDFNQWELLPYDLKKKSDDICIQKYGCNNTQLYNIIKAKMLQQNQEFVEESVDMKILINKMKYALHEGFTTGDQNREEILGYMKNGTVNDTLNKIQQSKDLMKFEDEWVIICDFLDDKYPDYTMKDLNNMYAKYNSLNSDHRKLSDNFSIQIWGRPVFGMYSYMKQKFETQQETKNQKLEFVPDEKDQRITNHINSITNESCDELQALIYKLDCYNKNYERSLYESYILEQFGDKIKIGKKSYRQDMPGVVPFLTYTEYLHNTRGLDQKKINRVDPFTYVFNSKYTAKELEEMYLNGEKDKLLEFGWNPEIRPTSANLNYAREKQIKWFDEYKTFDFTDLTKFEFLGEATELSTNSLTPLFLVIACDDLDKKDPRAQFGKFLGFNTLKNYKHIGLSLESSLQNIYTFESVSDKEINRMRIDTLSDYEEKQIFVLAFFVKTDVKNTIRTSLKNYMSNQDNSIYSFDNVMSIVKDKPDMSGIKPYIVIGKFLDSIFKISNLYDNYGKQKIGAGLNQYGGRFYVLFSGPAKQYKENKIKKKIDGLKKVGIFSSLNFFGANNTKEEYFDPSAYGYYTFDSYLKQYKNEAVNNIVSIIRQDILNPENNELKWVDDSRPILKDDIVAKIKDIELYCKNISIAADNEMVDYLQRIKTDKMFLLKVLRDGLVSSDYELFSIVKMTIDKASHIIKYYENYTKHLNYQPPENNEKIVIHDTIEKFRYSSENFKFD